MPVEDLEKWDTFVEKSPQGTLFSLSCYLNAVEQPFELFYVVQGEEVRAGIALIKDAQGDCKLHDHVIYNGVLFPPSPKSQGPARQLSDEFDILTYISGELPRHFSKLEIALSPNIKDLRPFLWLNYNGCAEEKWELDLRYTSYVDISDCAEKKMEDSCLYKEMSISRRQRLRYAKRDGVFAQDSTKVQDLIHLYDQSMRKGGVNASPVVLSQMQTLVERVCKAKKGRLYTVNNGKGEVASAAFFGLDAKRAYYIFGGNHPEKQDSYSGTVNLWDAFTALSQEGIKEVDMEGVNSPQRGWFKLSMGGNLLPYYQVYYGW